MAGRKKSADPVAVLDPEEEALPESTANIVEDEPEIKPVPPAAVVPFAGRSRGWIIPRAIEIMIHKQPHMSTRVFLTCGTRPTLEIVRGVKVIIPWEAYEILKSTKDPRVKCDMNVTPPQWYTEEESDYEWSEYGEKTWDEYEAFLGVERKKPTSAVARRRLM